MDVIRVLSLKRENWLVTDLIDGDITKEDSDRLLEILIKNHSVKRNKVEHREYLCLPKEYVQRDQQNKIKQV